MAGKRNDHPSTIYQSGREDESMQIWLVRHAQSKSQTGEDGDVHNPELSNLGIDHQRNRHVRYWHHCSHVADLLGTQ